LALSLTSALTEWDDCDTVNWSGDPTVGLDTDFFIEGTGSIGFDVDIETLRVFGNTVTAVDLTNNFVYAWMLSFSAPTLDVTSAGGVQLCLADSSGNESYWYVGGSDNYPGGWQLFSFSTAETPSADNGTPATLNDIVQIGAGFKNTAKSKLADNCFVDWIRYGTGPALTITGTNATTDAGWTEVLSLDEGNTSGANPAPFGIIAAQPGGFVLRGPVEIGDSSGTATTNFTDTGSSVVFDGLPVGTGHYAISVVGNSTGTTDVRLGTSVGSGDSRAGANGNTVSVAPIPSGTQTDPVWSWDSQTDIADIDSVQLYGCTFSGAKGGVLFDGKATASDSSIISCNFVNCGALESGGTSNGVELLNSFIIDPDGNTNNYGLQFDQTPSAGTMTTNIKKVKFITSGTPSTQYMTHFPFSGDYTVGFEDMEFFGDYSSGTLFHGLNSGTDADVTINSTGTTNANQSEFESSDTTGPDTGSVTVQASVSISVKVVDSGNNDIQNAQTTVRLSSDNSEIINADTNASGEVSGTFSGTTPAAALIKVRKSSSGDTRYENFSTTGTIESGTGLSVTVVLTEDGAL